MNRQLDFRDVSLYAVTSGVENTDAFFDRIEKLLKGGVDAIQLRAKNLSDKELLTIGQKIKKQCTNYEALFIVNNRPDIALVLNADGVHLGHQDMPIFNARELLGHRKLIGASTHSMTQAIQAQKEGADYVSCGPIWATPTKPTYDPVGLNLIGLYRAALKIPFVVIGGINLNNVGEITNKGGVCVAVVRALFQCEDPEKTAKEFKQKILNLRESKKELV